MLSACCMLVSTVSVQAQEETLPQSTSAPVTIIDEPTSDAAPVDATSQTINADSQQSVTNDISTERTLSIAEQERIINLITNVLKKFTSAVNRLDNIASRLEDRMDTMQQGGVSIPVQAETAIIQAKNQLGAARGSIESVRNISNVISSDTPRASFQKLRTELNATHDLIRAAHTNLIVSVQTLRNPPQNILPSPEATSSASSSETIIN